MFLRSSRRIKWTTGFIRKVYGILSTQLAVSTLAIFATMQYPAMALFIQSNPNLLCM